MSRTRHHRRRVREVALKKFRVHHKPSKQSKQWYVLWAHPRSFQEEEHLERLVYANAGAASNLTHWDYELFQFQPWNYTEVRPLLEKLTRLRGSPCEWSLGDNPPLPGWKERK